MRKMPEVFIITGLIVALLITTFKLAEKENTIEQLKSKLSSGVKYNNKYNKDAITDWVFKHSNRISFNQAKLIVDKALTTKYPLLVLAIIEAESNFNPCAVSKSGAIGLMQILPTKSQLDLLKKNGIIKDKRDLFDIKINIDAGLFILSDKLKRANNDIVKALNYYVGGNQKYVREVLTNLGELYLVANND